MLLCANRLRDCRGRVGSVDVGLSAPLARCRGTLPLCRCSRCPVALQPLSRLPPSLRYHHRGFHCLPTAYPHATTITVAVGDRGPGVAGRVIPCPSRAEGPRPQALGRPPHRQPRHAGPQPHQTYYQRRDAQTNTTRIRRNPTHTLHHMPNSIHPRTRPSRHTPLPLPHPRPTPHPPLHHLRTPHLHTTPGPTLPTSHPRQPVTTREHR